MPTRDRTCAQCGKHFLAFHHSKKGTYCSRLCLFAAFRKLPPTQTCQQCKSQFATKCGQLNKFCSKRCADRAKVGKSAWNKGTAILEIPLAHRIRLLGVGQRWTKRILKRDGCCLHCGSNVRLLAHHIYFFSLMIRDYKIDTKAKALRCAPLWDTANGLTLCVKCHRAYHSLVGDAHKYLVSPACPARLRQLLTESIRAYTYGLRFS